AMEQNAQAKIQIWNAMRKIIPATGTTATESARAVATSQSVRQALIGLFSCHTRRTCMKTVKIDK
ncbi:hypothetical protein, partial [Klebsiella aerogenes]|uniref:hypothetical protein n=1 Tax=Klebsiella aerogenes TaxID=548 RepID=UPI001BCE014F